MKNKRQPKQPKYFQCKTKENLSTTNEKQKETKATHIFSIKNKVKPMQNTNFQ
jgi:hypothetical protein